ncbi:MAG TPA: WD40 repeat domain-containing protein [Polyangiaceae bacterium]|nr:WD40 repeat domain-containing protein [Polyangiaceae bacterium]
MSRRCTQQLASPSWPRLLGLLPIACALCVVACGSDRAQPKSGNTACAGCAGSAGGGDAGASDPFANVPACLHVITTIEGTNPYLYTVSWSPNSDFVLSGTSGEVRLTEVDTAAGSLTQVAATSAQPNQTYVQFSPDGQFALSASTDVRLLAIGTAPPSISGLALYDGNMGHSYALAWSPDGSHALIGCEDGTVRLLRVHTDTPGLEERAIFAGHTDRVFGVAWSPDGSHALSVGIDRSVRLLAVDLDAPSVTELASATDTDWESVVSWGSNDTPVLSGTWGYRNALQTWTIAPDFTSITLKSERLGQTPGMQVIEWSRDRARLITAEHEDTLHLFSRSQMDLNPIGVLGAHYTGVHAVAWSPDDAFLAVASSHGDILSLVDVRGCN